jgi:hypothetical protein
MANPSVRGRPSSDRIFDLLRMFNQLIVLDQALLNRLPTQEFELDFNEDGDVYVNGNPLGVNVPTRFAELSLKTA